MDVKKIFSGTIDLNPTYHGWPTVVITESGELLAACSGNRVDHVCPFGRVFFYRSADGGKTWTGPQVLSEGPLDDRDAGLCVAADGSILVNYFTSTLAFKPGVCRPEWEECAKNITPEILTAEQGLWMRRSTDNGKTWSEKYLTPVNNPHGPNLLKSGRLFMPGKMYTRDFTDTAMMSDMAAAVSDDNGVSWQILSRIPAPAGYDSANCHELHAVETDDGRIIVQIRDHNDPAISGSTWQTESEDGGKTWSDPRKICHGFPSHLIRFGEGKLLMVYGWRHEPFGIRAMVSEDSGKTWGEELVIYREGPNHDLGYPSTVEMPDGSLFTLWYESDGRTAHLNYCCWTIV